MRLHNAEFDQQQGNAQFKGMREIIAGENRAEDSVICLEGVEQQCKQRAEAVKRQHIAQNTVLGQNQNGNQQCADVAHMQRQVFQIRRLGAPYKEAVTDRNRSPQ